MSIHHQTCRRQKSTKKWCLWCVYSSDSFFFWSFYKDIHYTNRWNSYQSMLLLLLLVVVFISFNFDFVCGVLLQTKIMQAKAKREEEWERNSILIALKWSILCFFWCFHAAELWSWSWWRLHTDTHTQANNELKESCWRKLLFFFLAWLGLECASSYIELFTVKSCF